MPVRLIRGQFKDRVPLMDLQVSLGTIACYIRLKVAVQKGIVKLLHMIVF